MNARDFGVSIVRTLVPVVVGFLLAQAAKVGIEVDEGTVSGLIETVFIGGYYAVVRYVESKVPKAGWLLGYPLQPTYVKP